LVLRDGSHFCRTFLYPVPLWLPFLLIIPLLRLFQDIFGLLQVFVCFPRGGDGVVRVFPDCPLIPPLSFFPPSRFPPSFSLVYSSSEFRFFHPSPPPPQVFCLPLEGAASCQRALLFSPKGTFIFQSPPFFGFLRVIVRRYLETSPGLVFFLNYLSRKAFLCVFAGPACESPTSSHSKSWPRTCLGGTSKGEVFLIPPYGSLCVSPLLP